MPNAAQDLQIICLARVWCIGSSGASRQRRFRPIGLPSEAALHEAGPLLASPHDIVRRKTDFPQQLIPGRQTLPARAAGEFVGYKPKPFLE